MISVGDLFGFSWKELERQQRRVLPGLIGVAAGVALLLSVVAGTNWLSQVTNREILSQGGLSRITVTPGQAPTFTNDQVLWMRSLGGVQDGYPIVMGAFPAAVGADGTIFQMNNTPSSADRPALVSGTWPGANEVVVPDGQMVSRRTGAIIPTSVLIGSTATLTIPVAQGVDQPKSWTVKVVGAYRWSEDQGIEKTVYTPLDTLVAILSAQGSWSGTAVASGSAGFGTYVIDADRPEDVAAIAGRLEAKGFRTQYVEQSLHGLSLRIQSIQAAAGLLVLLIVAFAALSISNTLGQSVRQRRREIAVLLAIGFEPRWIATSLVFEAGLIGLVSIVVGVFAAMVITTIITLTQGIALRVDLTSVLVIGLGALVFCVAASWLPSRRVMHIDPVAVLREE